MGERALYYKIIVEISTLYGRELQFEASSRIKLVIAVCTIYTMHPLFRWNLRSRFNAQLHHVGQVTLM